jgi:hypothetical protein
MKPDKAKAACEYLAQEAERLAVLLRDDGGRGMWAWFVAVGSSIQRIQDLGASLPKDMKEEKP